jgi:hypothetical protein
MSESTIHTPCDEAYYYQGEINSMCRGVTTWNLQNQFTVSPILAPNGGCATVIFTCTTPKCYGANNTLPNSMCADPVNGTLNVLGQDAVNINFNAWKNDNSGGTTSVQLHYRLNDQDIGDSYLSEVSTHGATQTYELANINAQRCSLIYNDMGRNTFVFQNLSNDTIQLDHVKIYRIYKMCTPGTDYQNACTGTDTSYPCYAEAEKLTTIGFDATCTDTPCYCERGGLSTTHYQDRRKAGVSIPPNGTVGWTFNFGALPYNPHRNYVGKSICLFNFNNIQASTDAASDNTIHARLNGVHIDTYYLSKYAGNALAPSHDLAKENNYHDTLPNTVELVNASAVTIEMGQGGGDGVDVYRIYESSSVTCCGECQTTCQTCQTTCDTTCQVCVLGCEIFCYMCETCETACEFACQDCQTCDGCVTCNTSCQWCNTCQPCESCYGCYNSCQLCDTCEGGCLPGCYACQSGY